MKKKAALLIVRKNYREIDWILPLLYKINKEYKLITFFQNKISLKKFSEENITLYKKWKKINLFYFSPPIKYILLNKIFQFLTFKNKYLSQLANEYFRKKIYSKNYLEQVLFKNNLGNYNVKLVFHEYSKNTSWINSFLGEKDIKIIKFPDATVPKGNYKIDKSNSKKIKYINNLIILASSKNDLSLYKNLYNQKNIKIVGYPRYEDKWVKFFTKNKINKSKKIFLVGCKQYKPNQKNNIKSQINSIMNATSLIKNSLTIFKPHPAQDIDELKSMLSNFEKNLWKVSNDHVLNYKNLAELFIGFHRSSTVLDALACNLPTVKLWSWKAMDKNDFGEQRYIKRYGIHNSILTELKLTKLVLNENELKRIILSNKQFKNKLLKKQKINFRKLTVYNSRMAKTLREIFK